MQQGSHQNQKTTCSEQAVVQSIKLDPFLATQEVGRAVAWQEKGLPEVTAEAKLIFDDHAFPLHTAKMRLTSETNDQLHHADSSGICNIEFGPM